MYIKNINAVFAILSKAIFNLNLVRIIYHKNIAILNGHFFNLYKFV